MNYQCDEARISPDEIEEIYRNMEAMGLTHVFCQACSEEMKQDIVEGKKSKDVYEALVTMPSEKRKQLAKYLKAVLGKKQPKPVSLSEFKPKNPVIFEETEIEDTVTEFRKYIKKQWEEGYYLKLEK